MLEKKTILLEEEEDDDKTKSFRLSLIKSPELLDETYKHDFENVDLRLKLAMNAYVDFEEPIDTVDILVANHLVNHIDIASFFTAWRKTEYIIEINKVRYRRFEVNTTNPNYNDVIPTILKYMPHILVESPDKLKEAIDERMKIYQDSYV